MSKRKSIGPKVIINLFFVVFSLLCVIPIILIISISLSSENDIYNNGFSLIPHNITLFAYNCVLQSPKMLFNSYAVSIMVTVIGTLLSIMVISMLAYPLSRKDFSFRNGLMLYVFFTMIFNAGLVPTYIIVRNIAIIQNTIWVLILPYLANAWFILLMRTFMQSIDIGIIEAAKIDGASEFRIFSIIILPLSKPALATIGLFSMLQYWNDWWLALLYIDNEKLVPIQLMLSRIMSSIELLTKGMNNVGSRAEVRNLPRESARMALCIIAAGPMLFIFPFFQKYFVRGLTLGGVKG